jgi:hypothetical protein
MASSNRDRLKEIIRKKLRERNEVTNEESSTASAGGYNTPFAFGKDTAGDIRRKVKSAGKGFEFAKSIDEAKKQLAEVENLLDWYNKLKMENGVKNEDFYKRTNTSIFRIKERLNKIARTIIDF